MREGWRRKGSIYPSVGTEQQYATGSASAAQEPVGQLAMSGHIFGCHTGRGWVAGVLLASGVERLGMLLNIL